jgi:hypothetical protein
MATDADEVVIGTMNNKAKSNVKLHEIGIKIKQKYIKVITYLRC